MILKMCKNYACRLSLVQNTTPMKMASKHLTWKPWKQVQGENQSSLPPASLSLSLGILFWWLPWGNKGKLKLRKISKLTQIQKPLCCVYNGLEISHSNPIIFSELMICENSPPVRYKYWHIQTAGKLVWKSWFGGDEEQEVTTVGGE